MTLHMGKMINDKSVFFAKTSDLKQVEKWLELDERNFVASDSIYRMIKKIKAETPPLQAI